MNISSIILAGMLAAFAGTFLGLSTTMIILKYLAENKKIDAWAMSFGNSLPQFIWAIIAGLTMYGAKFTGENTVEKSLTAIGIAFIFFIAYRLYVSKPKTTSEQTITSHHGFIKSFMFGATLSLTAPQRLLFYIPFFAGFGVHYSSASMFRVLFLLGLGAIIGAIVWRVLFIIIFGNLHKKMTPERLLWINKAAGIFIALLGVFAIYGLFH